MATVKIDIKKQLEEFLKEIRKNKNELARWAYLVLTGTFEDQFRDCFAYYLHSQLGQDFDVGRDLPGKRFGHKTQKERNVQWADIAIVRKGIKSFACVVKIAGRYLFYAKPAASEGGNFMQGAYVPLLYDALGQWKEVENKFGIMLITDVPHQTNLAVLDELPALTKHLDAIRLEASWTKKGGGEERRKTLFSNMRVAFIKNQMKVVELFEVPLQYGAIKYSLWVYLVKVKNKR